MKGTGMPDLDVWALGDAAMIIANQKTKYLWKQLNAVTKDQRAKDPFRFHNAGRSRTSATGRRCTTAHVREEVEGEGGGAVRVFAVALGVLHHDAELEEQVVARSLPTLLMFVTGKWWSLTGVSRVAGFPFRRSGDFM
ncbi:uncharacterized protein C8Q71DRAFT_862327 [Rhodofomes roseus]|uniref:Uncharacterized protein n=1 Tax=Rhodofomes roseus TaxID=34475 RepID=A0ABQ8K1M4_9APHY|nr:uncharacterized protein C8Q71DRAFT_862327 [Rhodofomes roseus]KAH9830572.1 hypothetical protein C8Q71DRAFT_862327 [Rhodofomes roseus]